MDRMELAAIHENAMAVLRGKGKAQPPLLAAIADCRRQLALDFDTPARQIMERHAVKLGLNQKQFNRLCELCTGL